MIKKGGLGTIPKGLEWIVHKNETQANEGLLKTTIVSAPHEVAVTAHTESAQPLKAHIAPIDTTSKTAVIGLPSGFTRATFIIKQEHVDRLKAIAFVRKKAIKDVVDEIMVSFLKDTNVESILLESLKNSATKERF